MKRTTTAVIGFIAILSLILNSDAVSSGAREGIDICLQVIIPSLFPFFVITSYLSPILPYIRLPGLKKLSQKLHTPAGTESLILLGFLGGYPTGAKIINDTYSMGIISRRDARIMLGFCNNAGPAFIFGVCGVLFTQKSIPLLLWLIQIISAIFTGILLPNCSAKPVILKPVHTISVPQALTKSIHTCASVCGWIILFRAAGGIFNAYFPDSKVMAYFFGLFELSAGCVMLQELPDPALRFILSNCFLSLGGLCIAMQTASSASSIGLGLYLPGKLIQTFISALISVIAIEVLFPNSAYTSNIILFAVIICSCGIFLLQSYCKKTCSNYQDSVV